MSNTSKSYTESEDSYKSIAVSASVYIYNAQTKATQPSSMVKSALKAEGCTSWSIHRIVTFQILDQQAFKMSKSRVIVSI